MVDVRAAFDTDRLPLKRTTAEVRIAGVVAEADDVNLDGIRRVGILLQLLVALHDAVMPISGHEGDSGCAGRVFLDLRHHLVVSIEGLLVL